MTHTVKKSGDNYHIYLNGKRVEGPPHATRATALKYAQIMDNDRRRRQGNPGRSWTTRPASGSHQTRSDAESYARGSYRYMVVVSPGGKAVSAYDEGKKVKPIQTGRSNPIPSVATIKRDVWVPAKVMVTKAGKILAKVAGSVTKPKRNPNSFGSKVRAYQTKLSPNRVNVYVDSMGEYVVTYERRDGIKGESVIKHAKQLQVADNYARQHARKYLK